MSNCMSKKAARWRHGTDLPAEMPDEIREVFARESQFPDGDLRLMFESGVTGLRQKVKVYVAIDFDQALAGC